MISLAPECDERAEDDPGTSRGSHGCRPIIAATIPLLVPQPGGGHELLLRAPQTQHLGQRLLDANRTIGQPNKISVIFGRKVSKQYRGKLQTEIEDIDLPNPVIRSHYRNGFIKQYVRDHLILRTEAASNNVNDYGVNKAVENLPATEPSASFDGDELVGTGTRRQAMMRPGVRLATWDRPPFRMVAVAIALLVGPASTASAQLAGQETGAQSGPQDPRSTRSDTRPGESLSDRLERTDGVIRPPAEVTAPMPQASPPDPNPGTTRRRCGGARSQGIEHRLDGRDLQSRFGDVAVAMIDIAPPVPAAVRIGGQIRFGAVILIGASRRAPEAARRTGAEKSRRSVARRQGGIELTDGLVGWSAILLHAGGCLPVHSRSLADQARSNTSFVRRRGTSRSTMPRHVRLSPCFRPDRAGPATLPNSAVWLPRTLSPMRWFCARPCRSGRWNQAARRSPR